MSSGVSMMTLDQFAERNGIHRRTAERCVKGTDTTFPPLKAKRVKRAGGRGPGRIYITAEAEQAWKDAIPDA